MCFLPIDKKKKKSHSSVDGLVRTDGNAGAPPAVDPFPSLRAVAEGAAHFSRSPVADVESAVVDADGVLVQKGVRAG